MNRSKAIRRGTVGCTPATDPDEKACVAISAWREELNHALEFPYLEGCRGADRDAW